MRSDEGVAPYNGVIGSRAIVPNSPINCNLKGHISLRIMTSPSESGEGDYSSPSKETASPLRIKRPYSAAYRHRASPTSSRPYSARNQSFGGIP